MKEQIIEIITYLAPIVAGFITSVVIPFLVKKVSVASLEKKINAISEPEHYKRIEKELAEIKREILEMRGKTK